MEQPRLQQQIEQVKSFLLVYWLDFVLQLTSVQNENLANFASKLFLS
jgi:hypothetical protein